jgi:PAS domain S-box-containing protein
MKACTDRDDPQGGRPDGALPGVAKPGSPEVWPNDHWHGLVVAGLLLAGFILMAPFARLPWPAVPAFVPAHNAAIIVADLIVALLLFVQYREWGDRALVVLACGYLLTPILVAAHSLSFPDAFVPGQLIGGSQTSPLLWIGWHGLLPLFTAGYALAARENGPPPRIPSLTRLIRPRLFVLSTIALAAACIFVTVMAEAWLPAVVSESKYQESATLVILAGGWLPTILSGAVLFRVTRFRRGIDLWLGVMLLVWLIDIAFNTLTTERYQAGFYLGRLYGLLAAAIMLFSQLRQVIGAYRGLARSEYSAHLSAVRAHRAEAARRDTEDRYRVLFESIDEGFYLAEAIFDERGRCIDIAYLEENPAAIRIVGQPAKGRRMSDLGAYEQYWRDIFGEVAKNGGAQRQEHYAALNDSWFDFYVFKPPQAGRNQFAVIFQDVTERKRVEEALRRSEERHRLIVDTAREFAIFTTDADGRIDSWALGAQAIFGWSADEIIGQSTSVIFVPEDREANEPEKERAQARMEGHAPDVRWHLRKDGSRVFINGFVRPLHDSGGTVCGFLKIGRDETERCTMDQALRESETRFRQFGEASSDILWIRDAETLEFEYLSPAFETIYGQKREYVLGGDNVCRWADLILPEDRERTIGAIKSVRDGDRVTHEFRVVHAASQEIRWVRNTDFPLLDEAGRVQRIAGLTRDVTEQKRAEERQRLLLGELQHRVRNILAMIRSIASRTAHTSSSVRHYAANLAGRIGSLARTQALLTRSPGAGVDLRQLLRDELQAQSARQEQFALSGTQIQLAPKAAEVLTLAIHELATNATKYGALAKPAARIDVTWNVEEQNDESWLRLVWREKGLELDTQPTREGFGSELIKRRVPYELGGEGTLVLHRHGLECIIAFPLVQGESILQTDVASLRLPGL